MIDKLEPVSALLPSSALISEALVIDEDAQDIACLTNMLTCHFDDTRVGISMQYNIGKDYDWSKQRYSVSISTHSLYFSFVF